MKKLLLVILSLLLIVGCGKEEPEEVVQEEIESEQQGESVEIDDAYEAPMVENISIKISATGDVTLGNYDGQGFDGSFNETFENNNKDYSYFFQNVRSIFEQDDFTIVNLEGVLTTSEDKAPGRSFNIKGDPSYKQILIDGDVEAVAMDNNHRRDWGQQGITDTVNTLESINMPYAYEDNLGYYEVSGIKIGWVSVNPASFGAEVEHFAIDGIKKLQGEGVDLILACCHWGIEREHYPTGYQKELARKCIDAGADLVIGHHPHVLQGIEEYNGKLILYSLGNFCFGANKNPADKDTMIFQQTFHFEKTTMSNGDVTVEQLEETEANIIPCMISSTSSRNDYCPTPQTGDKGQSIIDRVNTYSKDFGVQADENGELQWTKENVSE